MRQVSVAQLVEDKHLANAVALNSTSFSDGRKRPGFEALLVARGCLLFGVALVVIG
ncbi:hypothetical protein KX816_13570 [Sphingosinicellaceae bacterium]|nr:hypothetical protein KX816_13570 [Sphingosinicellaceae bacterium]